MDFVTPLLGLLVPHLPALLNKAAENVVGEGAKKAVFEVVPSGVKAIWAKLWPKVEASAVAKESAKAIEADPEDQDSIEMLKLALKKMLKEIEKSEPELLSELKQLMKSAETEAVASTIVNIDVKGDENQTTGINHGKTVRMGAVTGDVNL